MDFSWFKISSSPARSPRILFCEQDKPAKRDMQPSQNACIHQIMPLRRDEVILLNGLLTPSIYSTMPRARPSEHCSS
jgi:hypothetical protein